MAPKLGTEEEDEDDVPLARILQRRQSRRRSSRQAAKRPKTRPTEATKRRLWQPLCEVGERQMMEFLAAVPDRLRVEAVCKRWRRMSRELSITELDFGQIAARPTLRRDVVAMIQRANEQLTRLALPDVSLVDENVELVMLITIYERMQKKHVFNILKHCASLQTLELLDCRALTLTGWPRDAAPLREVYLNGCNFVTNQAASSLIRACGATLERLTFTEATSLNSQIFRDLARHSTRLEELTVSHSNNVRLQDLRALAEALWGSLRWLDLSSCRGISSFPDSVNLPQLQVLILDKSKINDDGLQAVSKVATSLSYLSLQDCRAISDSGIAAIASSEDSMGCAELELIDLKGTAVTDASIEALESRCSKLHLVRVDSCRSVSRKMRRKYYERTRRIMFGGRLSKFERIYAERKKIEMIDAKKNESESDDESESDLDEDDDYVIQVRRSGAVYRRRR
ncbi:hypothetical protein PHYBOEH_005911 [Phytophthora boehmeriae]|uniref:F-box/LRR-repeat protein 15-like leucin rich repeat domain-containing protein n=1 Tax=Phytophthora boehmeriae TaxID=109152 RepID=A0A8T1WLF6_9STRA|nr:hypothetical protein PHYBOEH_005911 [Phytophthora boehmeriae]